jgi:hypothetical protein
MAVAGVEHGDAAGEVDIFAAVSIPEVRIFGAVGTPRGTAWMRRASKSWFLVMV